MRSLPRQLALLVLAWMACGALAQSLQREILFDIPAQPLASAVIEFSKQAQIQVLASSDRVGKAASPGVKGRHTIEVALQKLLEGTGFGYREAGTGTVTLVPMAAKTSEAPLAPGVMEAIVVTAQKREQRIQDVPVPVSVVNAEALAASSMVRVQEYYDKVAGLNVTPSTQSGQFLTIRGLSAGSGNPTVGVTVDEVPFGSSTFLGGGAVIPDIDPADLARIEVLRGPQGTLYGASSIGGLMKFVTLDPAMDRLSGRLQVTGNDVAHGELGYGLRGAVNIPVGQSLAFRASAFTRRDPGYIDNPTLQTRDVNGADAYGGRLAMLWWPTDALSVKLSALHQKIKGEGSSDSFLALGELQQSYIAGTGAYEREVQAYSATLTLNVGPVELTSITGYNINEFSDSFDGTFAFGPGTMAIFGVPGTPQFNDNRTRKVTQELRAGSAVRGSFNWVVGGFFTDEDSSYVQRRYASEPATGTIVGTIQRLTFPTTFRESAVFGTATFRPSPPLEIQVGGRQTKINQSYSSEFVNRLGAVTTVPKTSVDTDASTYLGTIAYRFSPQVMAYARAASGYRAGGPNVTNGVPAAPTAYEPDRSDNYEVGLKGELIPRRLSIDASLYDIHWKDIQLTVRDPPTLQTYTINGGTARSKGIEVSLQLRPTDTLTLTAWGAYTDAVLTESFPAASIVRGSDGDRLPFGSKHSGNLSARQALTFSTEVRGHISGSVSYIGDRVDRFGAGARIVFPSYTKLDLAAGFDYASWTLDVFLNNATDERGQLAAGLAPNTRVYIQPRLFGITLTKTF